ncbi:MAG: 2-oxo acid dehydrogenase subunit E2 [Oscillospiraceae bacterium]|jgi:pyruvate dehydrogenase E2 component (dihydrolipoamide acetyltransferase)|nr:2-oxo acid dehydrogenase subunit E2 [Oscillospiraceae bacterium]
MAKAVVMPKAGITVESCIISEWLKRVGDRVEIGDILFTYETDKALFECESTAAGVLLEIFYGGGDEVACLVPVCAVGEKGEDISALRPGPAAAHGPADTAAAAPAALPKLPQADKSGSPALGPDGAAPLKISPRAKNLAGRSGADPALASGTGPNGRVIERDVCRLLAEGPAEAAGEEKPGTVSHAPAAPAFDTFEYEEIKFSGIRRAIARSMFGSLQSMAQLTHSHSFDTTEIRRYREKLKKRGGDFAGITLGDMVLFAVSRTLLAHPDLNAHLLDGDRLRRFTSVNLGVAVDTARGLMVPTVFGADKKSLLDISREVKALAAQCREGNISPDLLRGGTFTVSNLGFLGVESFTPVINPPQTGILGLCGITQRPRETPSGLALYPAMGLSLTYDHRAVDGAPASRFMKELCEALESFTALLAL